ncbi:MAG: DegV family protein [Candidatus Promineifilaceae bacterium]
MKLGIVTDSTSDLPQYLIDEHALEVIPTLLILNGKEYADGEGISRDEFYARLPGMKKPPTTAAPSIGEFTARYQKLFDLGCDHILSIHAAVQLTTIVNTARQAAAGFLDRVTILDSGSLSLGLGFQVLAAAEAAENGLKAALAAVASTRERIKVFAALDTMNNLRHSGRVPYAVAALGGLLSIKPLIELAEGVVKPIGAVRTTRQANERMAGLMKASGAMERLAILHTGAEKRAREFLDRMMKEISQSIPRDIMLLNVTPVIGTHVGPYGLGFAAVRAQ